MGPKNKTFGLWKNVIIRSEHFDHPVLGNTKFNNKLKNVTQRPGSDRIYRVLSKSLISYKLYV